MWFTICKATQFVMVSELPFAPIDFRRHFLMPHGPPGLTGREPQPILSTISQGGRHGAPSPEPTSHSAGLWLSCSGFHLKKKPPLSRSFLQSSPGHTRHSDNFKAACWLRKVQPPIYSTHPFRLTAITISSASADVPASTWHVPPCPRHTTQYRVHPPCFLLLHVTLVHS